MDSYEVISDKSNPSSPSIEDLGAVGGDLYDDMSPENDLSRDSDPGVASFDPNLNVDDEEEQDFNQIEGDKHDFDTEEEEDGDGDHIDYDERSEETGEEKDESEEEENIEVTLKDNKEDEDDEEHPDLRKRLPPNSKTKSDQ